MNANELTSIDQVRHFLAGTQRVAFEVASDKQSRYSWVRRTLVKDGAHPYRRSHPRILCNLRIAPQPIALDN